MIAEREKIKREEVIVTNDPDLDQKKYSSPEEKKAVNVKWYLKKNIGSKQIPLTHRNKKRKEVEDKETLEIF